MRVVFFTGAGISRESGLQTFRDGDGLWEGQPVEEVCSTQAWAKNPARVQAFYNERRKTVREAQPNAAHHAIAELESDPIFEVAVVTQNIDDLHERAGSRKVVHLHGEARKSRSVWDEDTLYDCDGDLAMGDLAPDGEQLRPHVVFFGEGIYNYDAARSLCKRAEIIVVVGTSLVVYPAAYFVKESAARELYIVDPNPPRMSALAAWEARRIVTVAKPATEGVRDVITTLRSRFTVV